MKNLLFRDVPYGIGVILVLVSAFIYVIGLNVSVDSALGVFIFNDLFTAAYWGYVIFSVIFFRKQFRFCRIFPALVLALISAYSLNRSMNIFDASPLWFSVTLVVISIACLMLAFFKEMTHTLRLIVLVIIGVGMCTFLYLAIYLAPTYPISAFIFWILGISLHSFVPLLFLIFLIVWLCRYSGEDKKALRGLVAGITFVFVLTAVFTIRWTVVVNQINDTYRESFVEDDTTLPTWVRVSQRLPKNNITNKALKVGLTYGYL